MRLHLSGVVLAVYLFLGCAWIVFSDLLLARALPGYRSFRDVSLYKGLSFVLASSLVMYWITRLLETRLAHSGEQSGARQAQMVERLHTVTSIADELIKAPNVDTLCRRAVELSRERLGVERCAVYLLDGDTACVTWGTNRQGQVADERSDARQLGEGFRNALREREPGEPPWDLRDDTEGTWKDDVQVSTPRGWVCTLPIRADHDAVGILVCDAAITHAPFDGDRMEALVVLCSLLGQILRNKRAEVRQAQMVEYLRTVTSIADELIKAPDVDTLCRQAVELSREQLGVERCAIFLLDGDAACGTWGTDFQGNTIDERAVVHLLGTAFRHALRHREPGELPWDTRHEPYVAWEDGQQSGQGEGDVEIVPIHADHDPLGIFACDAAITHAPFDADRMEAVAILCSLLGHTIRNKRAELQVAESEKRYRRLFEDAVLGIFRSMPGGQLIEVNPAYARMFGYDSPMDALRSIKDIADLYRYPEHRPDIVQRVMAGEEALQQEGEYRCKDGRFFTGNLHVWAVRDEAGEIRHLEGFVEDISERKQLEREIERSRETAWAILNSTPDMAALFDTELRIVAANEAAAHVHGCPASELVGKRVLDCVAEEDVARQWELRMMEAMEAGQTVQFESEWAGRMFLHTACPLKDAEGKVTGVAGFAHELTALKLAQDSQRLAAVGQLAAGVAHDFNNLLSAMTLHAEIAKWEPSEGRCMELSDLVLRVGRRGAEICRNLMAFARPDEPQRWLANLEPCMEAALDVAARQLETAEIKVVRDYATQPPRLHLDVGQLELVFLNLIINAFHAMPEGGTLTLRTRYEPDAAVVEVADTGCGISPEHLPHVFEPFFTTKGRLGQSDTPGTGLGLLVSHGIVTAHGGSITATSQPGEGTVIALRLSLDLPLDARAEVEDIRLPQPQVSVAGGRILLIDDEIELAPLVERALAKRGISTVPAHSTAEGLEMLERETFDLVVADIHMPDGGAERVLAAAADLETDTPVWVMSGSVSAAEQAQMLQAGAWGCVEKPMEFSKLGHVLENALREVRSAAHARDTATTTARGNTPRVLVVDDEADVRRAATDALVAAGYLVTEAASTGEAAAALREGAYALVVSDLLMSGGGGRDVLALARALPHPPPVIIITGKLEGFVTNELRGAGAALCLQKPFNLLDLVKHATNLIRRF